MTAVRTIGVAGTFVEDTIDSPDGIRTRDLGGISYALATLSALLPENFRVRPVVAVGEDALPRVREFLTQLPGIHDDGLVPVDAVNNKVLLDYYEDDARDETLTGGVPPLPWTAYERWLPRHDGWLWNFISGMEVDRATFDRIKAGARGPLYVDLHSLCLEHPVEGPRRHRQPPDWEGWVRGATWVQLNELESGLLWRGEPRRLSEDEETRLAVRLHALGVRGVLATSGADGARWYGVGGGVATVPSAHAAEALDVTGCGDVFGAAWIALHRGHGLRPADALAGAVEAAGIAATVRGSRGLRSALAAASIVPSSLATARRVHGG